MADRKDYYYKQKVTESELDGGFAGLEEADRAIITDLGLVGVSFGSCNQRGAGANISIDVNAHLGYDDAGQRIYVPSVVNVPVAADYLAASTDVAVAGRSKILSVFLVFQRNLSDPRLDGNSISVFFDRAESYAIVVKQGAEALSPTAPPLEAGKLLICDITRTFGQTQILNANLSFARRQEMFRLSPTGPYALTGLTAKAIAQALQDAISAHVTGAVGAHAATAIAYAGGPSWRDGTTNPAATVEAQFDKMLTDLGDSAVNGTARVSSLLVSGVNVALAAGSARTQIVSLLSQLDTLWALLIATGAGVSGAGFVGAEALTHLLAGTVRSQLSALDTRSWVDRLGSAKNWPERASVTVTTSLGQKVPMAWAPSITSGGFGALIALANFATLQSPDGVEWTAWTGGSTAPWASTPKAVAAGLVNGLDSVLTGDSGTTGMFFSNNGHAWSSSGSTNDPTSSLLYAPGIMNWIAGGVSGKINTSVTGLTWTSQTVPVGFAGSEIVGLATNGSIVVAITSASYNKCLTSPDGVNWTERTIGATQTWDSVWYDAADGIFIAIGSVGAYKSSDGITWTAVTRPIGIKHYGLTSDGQGLWVCTYNTSGPYLGGIRYSVDQGATWIDVRIGDHQTTNDGYSGLMYAQNRFIVARANTGKIDFALSLRR